MAVTATPVFVQTPKLYLCQLLQGTDVAGTYKTIVTGAANGTKVSALWENNNDGSATHLVTVQLKRGSVLFGGAAFTTVSSEGFVNGTPAKNILSVAIWPGLAIDSDGNPYLFLESGDLLQATYATALTSSTLINLAATASDF